MDFSNVKIKKDFLKKYSAENKNTPSKFLKGRMYNRQML